MARRPPREKSLHDVERARRPVGPEPPISGVVKVAVIIAACSPYSPLAIMSALRIFCLAYSSNEMPDILAASTSCGVSVTLPGVMRLPDEFGTSRLTGALTRLDGFGAGRARWWFEKMLALVLLAAWRAALPVLVDGRGSRRMPFSRNQNERRCRVDGQLQALCGSRTR